MNEQCAWCHARYRANPLAPQLWVCQECGKPNLTTADGTVVKDDYYFGAGQSSAIPSCE